MNKRRLDKDKRKYQKFEIKKRKKIQIDKQKE